MDFGEDTDGDGQEQEISSMKGTDPDEPQPEGGHGHGQEFQKTPVQPQQISDVDRERIEKNRNEARARLSAKRAHEVNEAAAISKNAKYKSHRNQQKEIQPEPEPQKKRAQTEEQIRQHQELQNVVSTGQIVRVHGSKLIDTGGGFLLEESDLQEQVQAERIIVTESAAIIPPDCPTCELCRKEFSHSYLLINYEENVCDKCRDSDGVHAFITRTDAKQEFLLKDVDFDKREPILKYISKPNPHNSRWGDMKLYLRLQVERRALEVWGSLEEIEKHVENREDTRVQSKMKKYNKTMKALRMSARSSLFTKDLSAHVHSWSNESYNEEDDEYTHTCTECGQAETYEKL